MSFILINLDPSKRRATGKLLPAAAWLTVGKENRGKVASIPANVATQKCSRMYYYDDEKGKAHLAMSCSVAFQLLEEMWIVRCE